MNKWSCRSPACSCAGSSGLASHWVTPLEQRCCCYDLEEPVETMSLLDLSCPCDWFLYFKKLKYTVLKTTLSSSPTLQYSLSLALSALFWCCQHPAVSLQGRAAKCEWEPAALNSGACFFCSDVKLFKKHSPCDPSVSDTNALLQLMSEPQSAEFLQVFTSWIPVSHPAKPKVCAGGRLGGIVCCAEGCSRHCCRWGRGRNLGWEGHKVGKRI